MRKDSIETKLDITRVPREIFGSLEILKIREKINDTPGHCRCYFIEIVKFFYF